VECINGSGPIHVDIHIHLLSVGNLNPPNIHYRYMISRPPPGLTASAVAGTPNLAALSGNSVHDARFSTLPSTYFWRFADQWTECSTRCQGSQLQRLACVDGVNGKEVGDAQCVNDKRPNARQRMCNPDCFYKWAHRLAGWGRVRQD
jgi:thrombospondin motif-containing protein 9